MLTSPLSERSIITGPFVSEMKGFTNCAASPRSSKSKTTSIRFPVLISHLFFNSTYIVNAPFKISVHILMFALSVPPPPSLATGLRPCSGRSALGFAPRAPPAGGFAPPGNACASSLLFCASLRVFACLRALPLPSSVSWSRLRGNRETNRAPSRRGSRSVALVSLRKERRRFHRLHFALRATPHAWGRLLLRFAKYRTPLERFKLCGAWSADSLSEGHSPWGRSADMKKAPHPKVKCIYDG